MNRLLPLFLIPVAAAVAEEHHHGAGVELGEVELLGVRIEVEASGAFTPGGEVHVDLALQPATAALKAVRAWVGPERGRVAKSGITGSGGALHGHVDVPRPLPEGSALWIEVESTAGSATRASLPLPAAK